MIPPVRWKFTLTVLTMYVVLATSEESEREAKELSDDGWKPIIGHRETQFLNERPFRLQTKNEDQFREIRKEIKVKEQHLNMFRQPDVKKKEMERGVVEHSKKTEVTPKVPNSTQRSPGHHSNGQYNFHKMPSQPKYHPSIHFLTNQGFVQQKQPILTHRSQPNKHKYPTGSGKINTISTNNKRVVKPPRGPQAAYSQREEVVVSPPTNGLINGNNYAYFTQNNNNPTRSNQFGTSFYEFARVPIQQYVMDEYTRNLVPPPLSKEFFEQKPKLFINKPIEVSTETIPKVTETQVLDIQPFRHQQQQQDQQYYFINQNQNRPEQEEAIEVQVTKENVKEIPNAIPNFQYVKKGFSRAPSVPTYEVTEVKNFEDTPPYQQQQPFLSPNQFQQKRKPPVNNVIFLPTPVKPSNPIPTLPTQDEVSTIFNELSQRIKVQPEAFFDVKEVSTHYPILGKPITNRFEFSLENEITTPKYNKVKYKEETTTTTEAAVITTTPPPEMKEWQIRRRPNLNGVKRRKPIRNKFVEEVEVKPAMDSMEEEEREEEVTIKPVVRRKPIHRYRQRYRPNYQLEETKEEDTQKPLIEEPFQRKKKPVPELTEVVTKEQSYTTEGEEEEQNVNDEITTSNFEPENSQEEITIKETFRSPIPENEDTTLATTTVTTTTTSSTTSTTTTTTTEEPPTTTISVSNKLKRRRPIQYRRPSFSVKDYKQKINQISSTTTTTTPEPTRETVRTRLGYRTRRPLINSQYTNRDKEEETTEIQKERRKFIPKDPRHGANENTEEIRRRVVNRFRSTTTTTPQPTTTTKAISIKPNLYSNLRRPPNLSLRERIHNRNNNHNKNQPTTLSPTEETGTEEDELITTTKLEFLPASSTTPTTTTTIITTVSAAKIEEDEEEIEEEDKKDGAVLVDDASSNVEAIDVLKNDDFFHSQRVSDLTSSAQNDYNAPGVFKTVNSNVRRVPSYFTIATEDPILPIEAFFTNINKDKH